jgi:hypothetical protein
MLRGVPEAHDACRHCEGYPRYLDYLDRVVSAAPALYRKIYSQRCDTFNVDKKRKHLLRALDTWKGELDKWEHPLVKSWGSIFLPLRKLSLAHFLDRLHRCHGFLLFIRPKTPSWMCYRGFRLALISPSILAPARNCQSAFERFQRSRRTKWRSMPDKGAPTSCIAPPMASDPRSIATNPVLLTNSITSCLASVSSPDVKMTVRGLFGEKSFIQAIGMLLIDLTSRAPTGSTRPRPRRPSHEIAFSARLRGTSFKSALPGRQIGSRTWSGAGRGVK